MIGRLIVGTILILYVAVVISLNTYLSQRPVAVKLGSVPDATAIRMFSADQRYLVANWVVTKVLFYFGTLVEKNQHNISQKPEYFNMFKAMETVVKVDPYNMDAYYFAQAAFTWELGRAKDVNKLLAYGMKFRTWDYQLPFYAGFNAAYFLKDFSTAATYMQKAAELSGNSLFTTLAARYFYEAGQNSLGILFLDTMSESSKDPKVRKVYQLRRDALLAVEDIESAVTRFREKTGRLPKNLHQLVDSGFLGKIPGDPYGGRFYLDEAGKVRTTSKFVLR